MSKNPKISVIVPVYNVEKCLHRCVDSIREQTFTDFELLLIDDGSKDRSIQICDEYAAKDSRVRVFHKSNGGVSSARNLGLDNARGEWIAFCDADDHVCNNWLEVLIDNAREDSLIITGFTIVDYKKQQKENYGFDVNGSVKSVFGVFYSSKFPGVTWNKLYSLKKIADNDIRFNENISYQEDEEFVFSYLLHCRKIISVGTPTYCYYEPDWGHKYCNSNETLPCFYHAVYIYSAFLEIGEDKDIESNLRNYVTLNLIKVVRSYGLKYPKCISKWYKTVGFKRGLRSLAFIIGVKIKNTLKSNKL